MINDDSSNRTTGDESSLTVADLIQRQFDRLTPAERKPARLLLSNYPLAGLETLASYAEQAGVSHPSVLRFVGKLSFDGYAEFQATLRSELAARLQSPLAKRPDDDEFSDDRDFIRRFADASRENIRQTVDSLPRSTFAGAASLLADESSELLFLGGRFTDAIATYMYMHLRILRRRVSHITGLSMAWSEYLLDIDEHTVLVVFDIRRYQGDLEYFARQAAQRGARVLLITDQWLSPIANVADYVLPAHIRVPSNWDSVAAITTLTEALIAAVNDRKWPHLKDRINDLEKLRGQYEDTWPS